MPNTKDTIIKKLEEEIQLEKTILEQCTPEELKFYSSKQRFAFIGGLNRAIEIIKYI